MRTAALAGLALAIACAPVALQRANADTPAVCGAAYFKDAAQQLLRIEADRTPSLSAVTRRSTELADVAGPDSDLYLAIARPCPAATANARLTDVARLDALVVWSRLLALRAADAAIYPKPYERACYLYDLTAVQNAFIEAWTARLSNRGTAFSRRDVWLALGREPLFAHVAALASETAHHLGVRELPTIDSDEAWWLATNRNRHRALAARLEPGTACGPKIALYGLPPVESTTGLQTAATIRR